MTHSFQIQNTKFGSLARQLSGYAKTQEASCSREIILVELNHFFSHHCALPLIIRAFRTRGNYRIIPFIPLESWEEENPTLQFVMEFYKLMGVEAEVLKATPSPAHVEQAKNIINANISCLNGDIWALTNLEYETIPLGVYITEIILQIFRKTEIRQNIHSVAYSVGVIARYLWWDEYLKSNPVKFILSSHPCYEFVLPQLAGLKHGIEAYYWRDYELVRSNPLLPIFHGNESMTQDLQEAWGCLSEEEKKLFCNRARVELEARTRGKRAGGLRNDVRFIKSDIDEPHPVELKRNKLLNIVVYLHAFSDAPCILPRKDYGELCSPLLSAARLLALTDSIPANIYVKTHPAPFEQDSIALDELLLRHPSVVRLPGHLSPADIKNMGADLVITGWGSISHEALYLGLPVIAYSAFPPVSHLVGIPTFSLDSQKELATAIVQAMSAKLTDSDRENNLQVYAALNMLNSFDLTCSGLMELPREGENGRYSLNAFVHWAENIDLVDFETGVEVVSNFLSSKRTVLCASAFHKEVSIRKVPL